MAALADFGLAMRLGGKGEKVFGRGGGGDDSADTSQGGAAAAAAAAAAPLDDSALTSLYSAPELGSEGGYGQAVGGAPQHDD